jgi:hypothetical protein
MRIGFIASVIGHLIVVTWAAASFVSVQRFSTTEPIPVELVQSEAPTAEEAPKDPAPEPAKPQPTKSEKKVSLPPPATLASAPQATNNSAIDDRRFESSGQPASSSPEQIPQGLDPADVAALLGHDPSRVGSGALASVGKAISGRAITMTQEELARCAEHPGAAVLEYPDWVEGSAPGLGDYSLSAQQGRNAQRETGRG